jgi:hypothetical protein
VKKSYTRIPLDKPSMAFKNETALWIPLLNIRVGCNHKQTPRIPAVVDSGSMYCLFRADIGEFLGIDVKKRNRGNHRRLKPRNERTGVLSQA